MTDQPLASEAPPDGDSVEVDYVASYDEESGEYRLGLQIPGLSVAVHVTEAGFDALNPILSMLPQFCEQTIEQIAEARDQQVETKIAEETP